jgi:NADP-dependent 3-hydroxy acid dehydrogenase YdfG
MKIIGNNIAGKVVVITEATGESGEAIARHLAGEGARLVIGARDIAKLKKLANELVWDGATVLALETDITESPQAARLVARAEQAFGRVDVMVNNPVSLPWRLSCEDEIGDANMIAGVHMLGIVHGIVAAIPYLRRHAGHIINVAPFATPGSSVHSTVAEAIRHAVLEGSEGLREQATSYRIRTTLVAPGLQRRAAWANFVRGKGRFRNCVALQAASVARAVAFVIAQPHDVEIDEILFRQVQPGVAMSDALA